MQFTRHVIKTEVDLWGRMLVGTVIFLIFGVLGGTSNSPRTDFKKW